MPRSHQKTYNRTDRSWNAFEVLNLKLIADEDAGFKCVGKNGGGHRCGQPISKSDRRVATSILSRVPGRSRDPQLLRQDLEAIASLLLCGGYHREKTHPNGRVNKSQVRKTAADWETIIQKESARANARSSQSRDSNARPKAEKKPSFGGRKFKQEDNQQQENFAEPEEASETEHEDDDHSDFRSRTRRHFAEQEDFLRWGQERREEARRQSQRERAEQQEAKARAEREQARRQQEEEARRRQRERTPPKSQPKPTEMEDWNNSWTTYRQRWILVKDLPQNATLADLEKVFPWPLRNIYQLGLCKWKLDALFEKEVEAFFRHIPSQQNSTGVSSNDNKVIFKALRKEALCWHPDKVLVRFPIGAVPKALWELAMRITQVLMRLMDGFRV